MQGGMLWPGPRVSLTLGCTVPLLCHSENLPQSRISLRLLQTACKYTNSFIQSTCINYFYSDEFNNFILMCKIEGRCKIERKESHYERVEPPMNKKKRTILWHWRRMWDRGINSWKDLGSPSGDLAQDRNKWRTTLDALCSNELQDLRK